MKHTWKDPHIDFDRDATGVSDSLCFAAKDRVFPLGEKTYIMGILNITPDSFSDGGSWIGVEKAVMHAREMMQSGADIIDVGGESTRPGYTPVSEEEEKARVLPVIEALHTTLRIPVSIDTSKSSVAKMAADAGACAINDVWGCRRDPGIAAEAARSGAGLILMFNATDRGDLSRGGDIVTDAIESLNESIRVALAAGVAADHIMVDPGVGFGTDTEESLGLIRGLPRLASLGYPVLLGPSRKRFIGAVLDRPVDARKEGTVAVCCAAACLGAGFVRVHDVEAVAEALRMVDAIRNAKEPTIGGSRR